MIMVGEIRDHETAEIAINASLTGHLVFSTLHTNDAAGAMTRLIDMGIEPFLVSSSLTAVMAQRLVRRLCPTCRELYQPTALELERMAIPADDVFQRQLPDCHLQDHAPATAARHAVPPARGRAADVQQARLHGSLGDLRALLINDEMRAPWRCARPMPPRSSGRRCAAGMRTLRATARARCCAGITSVEEVMLVTAEGAAQLVPVFQYKGFDGKGKPVSGIKDADNVRAPAAEPASARASC